MADNNVLEKTLWAAADKLRSNMDAAELAEQFARGRELEKTIRENLKGIGYDF